MNVVLYLRYSSAAQNEQSIEGQKRDCTEYCRRNGYKIVGTYIDRAASASKDIDKRTQFLQMIEDSSRNLFQAVIVWSFDRFARNVADSATYKTILAKNNVVVLSTQEQVPDGPSGIIMSSIFDAMAEYYSAELSTKVRRGRKESAMKGHSLGGPRAFGYKTGPDKKIIINQEESLWVQKMFAYYLQGISLNNIARILCEVRVKTVQGSPFNGYKVRRVLTNPIYIGTRINGKDEYPLTLPSIIDIKTWNATQRRLRHEDSVRKPRQPKKYVFSKLLKCGMCGAPMVSYAGKSHTGKEFKYYRCRNHRNCENLPIAKEKLESAVFLYSKEIFSKLDLKKVSEELYQQLKEFLLDDSEKFLKKNIKQLTAEVSTLVDAIAKHGYSEALGVKLKNAEDELAYYKDKVEQSEKNKITPKHIQRYLEEDFLFEATEEGMALFSQAIIKKMTLKNLKSGEQELNIEYNLLKNTDFVFGSRSVSDTQKHEIHEKHFVLENNKTPETQGFVARGDYDDSYTMVNLSKNLLTLLDTLYRDKRKRREKVLKCSVTNKKPTMYTLNIAGFDFV